jgi:hypothetical protein
MQVDHARHSVETPRHEPSENNNKPPPYDAPPGSPMPAFTPRWPHAPPQIAAADRG